MRRRRWKLSPWVIAPLVVGAASLASAKDLAIPGYHIVQLTDNGRYDAYPRVSRRGLIVWAGNYNLPGDTSTDYDSEIFLYDPSANPTITQITHDGDSDTRPVVNDQRQIAWMKYGTDSDSEIFVWDNGVTTRVTQDSSPVTDRYPDINDFGYVVWGRFYLSTFSWGWALYRVGSGSPYEFRPEIHLYKPQINNQNRIAHRGLWIRNVDGNIVTDLPDADQFGYADFRRSEFNDRGQLVIEADPGVNGQPNPDQEGPRDILIWDGQEIKFLFSSPVWVGRPDLNSTGIIVFYGYGGLPGSTSGPDDTEIFVYDLRVGEVEQLTDDDVDDLWPTVDESGTIVWEGEGAVEGAHAGPQDTEIFLAVPDTPRGACGLLGIEAIVPIGLLLWARRASSRAAARTP